ncbi:hypothetical protein BD311DRAFT_789130 [Dichomitus squalens]|uniref:Uncharacterized protein n=1 Tax=Dichomitus squalens TaxID=114155 RepID=A0A4Q9MIU4_9APHY|nr:hypothetical protein BD311DRAFT_789130 [Dichomitus squalens]
MSKVPAQPCRKKGLSVCFERVNRIKERVQRAFDGIWKGCDRAERFCSETRTKPAAERPSRRYAPYRTIPPTYCASPTSPIWKEPTEYENEHTTMMQPTSHLCDPPYGFHGPSPAPGARGRLREVGIPCTGRDCAKCLAFHRIWLGETSGMSSCSSLEYGC